MTKYRLFRGIQVYNFHNIVDFPYITMTFPTKKDKPRDPYLSGRRLFVLFVPSKHNKAPKCYASPDFYGRAHRRREKSATGKTSPLLKRGVRRKNGVHFSGSFGLRNQHQMLNLESRIARISRGLVRADELTYKFCAREPRSCIQTILFSRLENQIYTALFGSFQYFDNNIAKVIMFYLV